MIYIDNSTTQIITFWNYVYKTNNFYLLFKTKDLNVDVEYATLNTSTSPYYLDLDTPSTLADGEYLLYIYNFNEDNITYSNSEYTLEYVTVNKQSITRNTKNIIVNKKYGR